MPQAPISFRPTLDDKQIIDAVRAIHQDMTPTDVLRQGLRLLVRENWRAQARLDAVRLQDENLADEPDDWSYDANGAIRLHLGGIS